MEDNTLLRETIIGEKIFLRPIEMTDTELIVKWRNTESVRQNFIFRETFTNEMHEQWMNTKVATGEVVQYIICKMKTKTPIGSVYFRDIDTQNKSAEFGIFIGEESQRGDGLGTEATKLFVKYGFDVLRLHRIFLRVLKENYAAITAYEKAGFEIEGCFRDMVYLENEFKNIIFMSKINRSERVVML